MANAIYPKAKQTLLDPGNSTSGALDLNTNTIKIRMVGATTVYNAAHQYLSDLAGSAIGTDQVLTSPTVVSGVFDAADPVWTAVASGSTVTALVIYRNGTLASNSDLICWFDTDPSGNLISLMTNGGDVDWRFDANGIFQL